jgi:predicted nucleic acid-binding protein
VKYILIDTNILLDMIAFRTTENLPMTYNFLQKLLEWGDDTIRLIVPAIVVQETIRNIDKIFTEIESRLGDIENTLQKGYWINLNEAEATEFKDDVNKITDKFKKYKGKLKAERNSYKEVLTKKIMTLVEHQNTIKIATNDVLLNNVYKRQIYKRCPFDRKTNALADALIVEILINIKEFIPSLSTSDKVYFITRNTSDFSEPGENKKILHRHIVKDLQDRGLGDIVEYRTQFYQMIKNDFSLELNEANLMKLNLEGEMEMELARQD